MRNSCPTLLSAQSQSIDFALASTYTLPVSLLLNQSTGRGLPMPAVSCVTSFAARCIPVENFLRILEAGKKCGRY